MAASASQCTLALYQRSRPTHSYLWVEAFGGKFRAPVLVLLVAHAHIQHGGCGSRLPAPLHSTVKWLASVLVLGWVHKKIPMGAGEAESVAEKWADTVNSALIPVYIQLATPGISKDKHPSLLPLERGTLHLLMC